MKLGAVAIRIALPLSAFTVVLLGGATLMGIGQGIESFSWMLVHGAIGPLGNLLIYSGRLNPSDLVAAIIVLMFVVARGLYPSTTIAILSVLAVIFWIIMGWGAAV